MGREQRSIEITYSFSRHNSARDLTDEVLVDQLNSAIRSIVTDARYESLRVSTSGLTTEFSGQQEFVAAIREALGQVLVPQEEVGGAREYKPLDLTPERTNEIIYAAWQAMNRW